VNGFESNECQWCEKNESVDHYNKNSSDRGCEIEKLGIMMYNMACPENTAYMTEAMEPIK